MGLLQQFGIRRPDEWEPPTLLDHFLSSPLHCLIAHIYHILIFLRGRPFRPPKDKRSIRIVCLSDTHDLIVPNVPDGDLLIHAGDLTNAGTVEDIQRQIDWLDSLPHRHKIVIAGNHDSWFDVRSRRPEDKTARRRVDFKRLHYLQNSSVSLDFADGRRLNIYGAADLPVCGGDEFAFQYPPQINPWAGRIPIDSDVLVTHTPPRWHRDLGLGCPGLLGEVWRVRPRLHVFGHVHWGRGQESVYFDECQRAYETFMSTTPRGPLLDFFPNRDWITAAKVIYYGLNAILFKYLMLGPGSNNASLMVNAGCMKGNTGRLQKKNAAQVVAI
ncbi:hypothetical protein M406DRAFT_345585 [Cryphonectria parasitica EP155]|uniref:Calcineurin-like phosphoesterase domain-containing protein n=1 Tax=Cryphonectria parasitica (strain ATCC 38755 / EP155) TaxID=660469 RepID=A0A9P5CQZ7_CRYP1|nr:uncharacterized protein M406DRAFT_345585 [Cryphonectria parasitica EP155]KAF3767718.1 hypothetical protein M406DRAFT_345585 [Cryphonectria parasitica EP155]